MKSFRSFDNTEIFYMEKTKVTNPKALLFILHGMAEHILRYEELAEALNQEGILVVGMDLRGHGQTGKANGTYRHFNDEDWFHIIHDLKILYDMEKKDYPNLPFFVLGHSMGSFLVRYLIQYYPDLFQGAIVMGTGSPEQRIDMVIARGMLSVLPPKKEAKLIHHLIFGSFQKKMKNKRTTMDWISSDPVEVDRYLEDPYCGFLPTNGFYKGFFQGLKALNTAEKHMDLDKNFPILLLSGEEDPVGDQKLNVIEYFNLLSSKGMREVTLTFYEDQRHDILHDKKRNEVMKDMEEWILERS